MSKEVARILYQARDGGAEVRRTRKGHWKVTVQGRFVTVLPGTPSDHRALRNARASLRRAGLVGR